MPGFAGMMKKQFKKEDQTLQEFMAELKELSHDDKMWYYEALIAEGYECDPPVKK